MLANRSRLRRKPKGRERQQCEREVSDIRYCFHVFISFHHSCPEFPFGKFPKVSRTKFAEQFGSSVGCANEPFRSRFPVRKEGTAGMAAAQKAMTRLCSG